jgi:hypothetical protein
MNANTLSPHTWLPQPSLLLGHSEPPFKPVLDQKAELWRHSFITESWEAQQLGSSIPKGFRRTVHLPALALPSLSCAHSGFFV